MKIIDYRIVRGNSSFDLAEKVNAARGFGWSLQGGVATNEAYFFQAMILIDNKSQNSPEPVFQEANSVG